MGAYPDESVAELTSAVHGRMDRQKDEQIKTSANRYKPEIDLIDLKKSK